MRLAVRTNVNFRTYCSSTLCHQSDTHALVTGNFGSPLSPTKCRLLGKPGATCGPARRNTSDCTVGPLPLSLRLQPSGAREGCHSRLPLHELGAAAGGPLCAARVMHAPRGSSGVGLFQWGLGERVLGTPTSTQRSVSLAPPYLKC